MIHRIVRSDYNLWQPIWEQIVKPNPGCFIASNNRPTGTGSPDSPSGVVVQPEKWAKVYGLTNVDDSTKITIANDAVTSLTNNDCAVVVFDELSNSTLAFATDISEFMRTQHPELKGRWGFYLVSGSNVSYAGLRSCLTSLINASAFICPELYMDYTTYCSIAPQYTDKDKWLESQINGNSSLARLNWLHDLQVSMNKFTQISPVVGVTDKFNSGLTPSKMIDRTMWGILNSTHGSRYGVYMGDGNAGGIGSWKWDATALTDTNRANDFVISWNNYSRDRKKTSPSGMGYPVCGGASTSIKASDYPPAPAAGREFATLPREKPLLDNPANKIEKGAGRAQLYRTRYKQSIGTVETKPTTDNTSIIDLYLTEVTYGYGVEGQEYTSKYYIRFYPTSAYLRNIKVTGICRDEREYEDLSFWIRSVQSDIARAYISFMGLRVPSTGVDVLGFIPKFSTSLGGYGNPVPVGIPYQFEITVIKDNTDPDNILSDNIGRVAQGFYDKSAYWKSQGSFGNDWYVKEAMAQIQDVGKASTKTGKTIKTSVSSAVLDSMFSGGLF